MILKKSYWAKWLENNRRRSWTFLLCLVMALFCGPLYLMVVLTGLQNNYANDSVYNAAQAAESLRELIQSRITDVIGFSFIHVFMAWARRYFVCSFGSIGICIKRQPPPCFSGFIVQITKGIYNFSLKDLF